MGDSVGFGGYTHEWSASSLTLSPVDESETSFDEVSLQTIGESESLGRGIVGLGISGLCRNGVPFDGMGRVGLCGDAELSVLMEECNLSFN
jgi:hypothetical protein